MCRSYGCTGVAWLLALASLACKGTEPVTARELQVVAGDSQSTRRGDDVAEPLRVRVIASNGQPMQGAVVQWTVVQGQATVQPAQSTANSSGDAETHLVNLGTIGEIGVRASIPGAPPVTFWTMGLDPCLVATIPSYTIGTVVRGVLRALDCDVDQGDYWDFFAFSLTAQQALMMRVLPDTFAAEVGLWTVPGVTVRAVVYDDEPGQPASAKFLLAPGSYVVGASSYRDGSTGPYEFSASVTLPSAESCELVVVVRGIGVLQQLAATDCARPSADPGKPFYEDGFWLVLHRGEGLIATQSSTHFGPRLRLQRRSGAVIVETDGTATGTARIDFTADSSAIYRLTASSGLPQQVGEYTLTLSAPVATPLASVSGNAVVLAHDRRWAQSRVHAHGDQALRVSPK